MVNVKRFVDQVSNILKFGEGIQRYEFHIVLGGYCCAPGDDYGDCSEMIRYGMSLIDPNIDTNEFKCIHYRHPVPKIR